MRSAASPVRPGCAILTKTEINVDSGQFLNRFPSGSGMAQTKLTVSRFGHDLASAGPRFCHGILFVYAHNPARHSRPDCGYLMQLES
jgi:hypothetical protein